jgi:glycosyltransferase involved in cell wall biosynthesis
MGADWAQEALRSKRITLFIAVSELVRQQYLQGNRSISRDRVVTIPNAPSDRKRWEVDRGRARAALGIDEEFVFLSLSRYSLQKNIVGLVSTFDAVARAHIDAHLLIAGHISDPIHFAQAASKASSQHSSNQIHLREHTTAPAVLLAAADAFVLDSFFEGWALAPQEALLAGLPVITSETGGAIEQVGSGGTRGFVVPNPTGSTDLVDWETMRLAANRRQANATALEEAMNLVVRDRRQWSERRAAIRLESASRFKPKLCAEAHAMALRRADTLA